MTDSCSTVTLRFKRGDDFKLDLTVQDTNNTAAINAATAVTAAENALQAAQDATPSVAQDIIDAEAALADAKNIYASAIVVDISTWTILSEVRRGTKLVATLDVTVVDPTTGTFTLSNDSLLTQNWPIAELVCDIQFLNQNGKVSSDTFMIDVQQDVTKWPTL